MNMKKAISAVALLALCMAALFAIVCSEGKFDNPLDKKGTNWLDGDKAMDEWAATDTTNTSDGRSGLFDPEKGLRCDGTPPDIELYGGKSVTISTNDIASFKKYMHLDGGSWGELVTLKSGLGTPVDPPVLKHGNDVVSYTSNEVPAASVNAYTIFYTFVKPECRGKVPEKTVSRNLVINQYNPADTAPPVITLLPVGGGTTSTVEVGKTYNDNCVQVTHKDTINNALLTSIEVKDDRGNTIGTATSCAAVGAHIQTVRVRDFTVIYYATAPNGRTASATRTVQVVAEVTEGPRVTVVLKPYSHNIGGKPISHPDTTIPAGVGIYQERGVDSIYFISNGVRVNVPLTSVNVAITRPPALDNPTAGQRNVEYAVPNGSYEGTNYRGVQVNRRVFVTEDCGSESTPPLVTDKGLTLSIGAGDRWEDKWDGGFDVKSGGDGYPVWNYVADRGDLPRNLAVGTYSVTYVGLSRCNGLTTSISGTVKVTQ